MAHDIQIADGRPSRIRIIPNVPLFRVHRDHVNKKLAEKLRKTPYSVVFVEILHQCCTHSLAFAPSMPIPSC